MQLPRSRASFRFPVALLLIGAVAAAQAKQGSQGPPVVAVPPAGLEQPVIDQKVDEYLNAAAQVNEFSGAVLLADHGTIRISRGVGYANREWQVPNKPDTKFRIGSLTKQFTATLVMQLREEGKVSLEDSICKYIDPCPKAWHSVTLFHLLTHTSGIPNFTNIADFQQQMILPKSVGEILAAVRDWPLEFEPGSRFAYDNTGYLLLGTVIEKVSGQSFERALQDRILTPLHMSDTGYDWPSTVLPRRAAGYRRVPGQIVNAQPIDMHWPFAAGALYSTVEDLLKWDEALYSERLLKDSSKKLMWTPFLDGYAFGWNILPPAAGVYGGHPRMVHSGGIQGFASTLMRLPDVHVATIILSNNESIDPTVIGRAIAAIYFGQPYPIPGR